MKDTQKEDRLIAMTSREMNRQYSYNGENVTDLSVEDIFPTVIDNVVINVVDGHHTLFLPPDMTSMQFENFMKGRGGIVAADVKNYLDGKPHGKYALFEHDNGRAVIRLIAEDEWLKFEVSKLVHGTVKDVAYMVVRELEEEESIKTTRVNSIPVPDAIEEEVPEEVEEEEDDATSVPLFED
jgi:hypothetical protein